MKRGRFGKSCHAVGNFAALAPKLLFFGGMAFRTCSFSASSWRAEHLNQAIPLLEQTLEKQQSLFGSDHPDTLIAMTNLACAYQDAGQLAKAIPLLEQAVEKQKSLLGADHPNTLASAANLAVAYRDAGRSDQAIRLLEAGVVPG